MMVSKAIGSSLEAENAFYAKLRHLGAAILLMTAIPESQSR
jgi:hypothetical protein